MRCFYCVPGDYRGCDRRDDWLDFNEIERLIRAFAGLGVRRIRLTGGEPLLRKNLDRLGGRLSAVPGIEDLSLSTNGTLLAREAEKLRNAGITRLNVSLDSLYPKRFAAITGRDLAPVLEGLEAAGKAGFHPIKINMLALKGINEDEYDAMIEYCLEHDFTLRFIEVMPVGETGRRAAGHFLDLREVRRRLEKRFSLIPGVVPGGGPARYVRVEGTDLHIGFITPMSQHFCETCNRVRLSVDGGLYLCLGEDSRHELRPLLQEELSDYELREALSRIMLHKPARHEFNSNGEQVAHFMVQTGG